MSRKLKGSVVVITGASSGIGRATALAFSRRKAAVVLAARRRQALEECAAECRKAGATAALVVPTDVTETDAVDALAETAVRELGRIDVWVNNAGVGLYAPFEEAPLPAVERLLDVNLGGYIRGSRAALRQFKRQGSGVLINNASIAGKHGGPFMAYYATSKFAVVGMSESLRMELIDDDDIWVSTVCPAVIDTPFFQHAANYTGRRIKAMHPILDAKRVADAIVSCAVSPRREVIVGGAGTLQRLQRAVAPALAERALARAISTDHFADEPAGHHPGSLFEPAWAEHDGGIGGGWRRTGRRSRAALAAVGTAAVAVGVGVATRALPVGRRG